MESEPRLTPRENPLDRRLTGESNPRRSITQDSEPNTLPNELFRPPLAVNELSIFWGRQLCRRFPGDNRSVSRVHLLNSNVFKQHFYRKAGDS